MVILLVEDDVGRPNLAIVMFRSKDRHPNCNKVVVTLVIVRCSTLSVLLLYSCWLCLGSGLYRLSRFLCKTT